MRLLASSTIAVAVLAALELPSGRAAEAGEPKDEPASVETAQLPFTDIAAKALPGLLSETAQASSKLAEDARNTAAAGFKQLWPMFAPGPSTTVAPAPQPAPLEAPEPSIEAASMHEAMQKILPILKQHQGVSDEEAGTEQQLLDVTKDSTDDSREVSVAGAADNAASIVTDLGSTAANAMEQVFPMLASRPKTSAQSRSRQAAPLPSSAAAEVTPVLTRSNSAEDAFEAAGDITDDAAKAADNAANKALQRIWPALKPEPRPTATPAPAPRPLPLQIPEQIATLPTVAVPVATIPITSSITSTPAPVSSSPSVSPADSWDGPNVTGFARDLVAGILLSSPEALTRPCSDLQSFTKSVNTPLLDYLDSLNNFIGRHKYQPSLAVFMAIVGSLCAWDGPRVWQALFAASAALVAGCMASFEADTWDMAPAPHWLMVAQVAGTVALATWSGFEGTQVVLGSIIGAVGAYGVGGWARWVDTKLPGWEFVAMSWYATGASFGGAAVTRWRKPLLAAMAPLLGGFLISTSIGVVASQAVVVFTDHEKLVPWPPPQFTWIEAGVELLGSNSAGVLAGHVACVLVTVFLQSVKQSRPLSVFCLVFFILTTLATSAMSSQCDHLDGPLRCPSSWKPAKSGVWEWSIAGCAMWAAITSLSAWRQFGKLEDWESNSIWRTTSLFSNSSREAPLNKGFGVFGSKFGVLPMGHPQYQGIPMHGRSDTPPRAVSFATAEQNTPPPQKARAQSFSGGETVPSCGPMPGTGGWRAINMVHG